MGGNSFFMLLASGYSYTNGVSSEEFYCTAWSFNHSGTVVHRDHAAPPYLSLPLVLRWIWAALRRALKAERASWKEILDWPMRRSR